MTSVSRISYEIYVKEFHLNRRTDVGPLWYRYYFGCPELWFYSFFAIFSWIISKLKNTLKIWTKILFLFNIYANNLDKYFEKVWLGRWLHTLRYHFDGALKRCINYMWPVTHCGECGSGQHLLCVRWGCHKMEIVDRELRHIER